MATIPANNNTGLYNTSGVPAATNNNITVSGNVNANNFNATSQVNAGTNISAAGNITAGGYFIGDGSLLTNIDAGNIIGGYGNANVANYLESGTVSSNVITTANVAGGNVLSTGVVSAGGNVRGANFNTVGVVSAAGNITGSYILGNGAFLTGLATYGNADVAAFLPTYTGNLAGGNGSITNDLTVGGTIYGTFSGNISGNLVVPGANTQVIYNNSGNAGASADFTFNNSTKVLTVTGNIDGGNINTPGLVQAQGILSNSSIDAGTSMSAASMSATTISASGNISASGYFIGDGSLLTGLPASYSNAQVAAYLASGTNSSNIITSGNITGSYVLGNGAFLTGLAATYGNAQVAAYLASGTNTSNIITTGNVSSNSAIFLNGGKVQGDFTSAVTAGRTMFQTTNSSAAASTFLTVIPGPNNTGTSYGGFGAFSNADPGNASFFTTQITSTDARFTSSKNGTGTNLPFTIYTGGSERVRTDVNGNVGIANTAPLDQLAVGGTGWFSGNVTAPYFVGNGAALTGITGTYGDSNVTTLLAALGSNVISSTGNVTTTANISGAYILGNGSQLTGLGATYSNANVVSMLAANSNVIIGNVNAYPLQANITTLMIGGNAAITSGAGVNSQYVTLLNNIYYDNAGNTRYRNTTTTGAAIMAISGGNLFYNPGFGNATANVQVGLGTGFQFTSAGLATVNGYSMSSAGNIAIAGTGGLTTSQTTGNLFNTTATTVNLGGAATTINAGAATVNLSLGAGTGNLTVNNVNAVGVKATGAFTGTFTDGTVVDYVTGNGRISVGTADGINFYNSGIGNVSLATLSSTGAFSATGNVTAPYFVGNGSQLTGIVSSYGNTNVAAYLASGTNTSNIITTGNVTAGYISTSGVSGNITGANYINANYFVGNGSLLTGIASTYGDANVVTLLGAFGSNTISTTGTVTAGNITGGNVLTGGLVSATGTITSAANITGGNINTAGIVSATSNITGGNLLTTGVVSATSLTANTQIGNLLLLNQQIQTTQASNVGLSSSLVPNPGRVYLGSGYNGNTSPAYDLTNYGRSGRLVISDSISITDANSLYRGLAIQNYYTLNGNINSTNTRIGGLVTGTIVGGGPSANTVAGGALAVAGTVNTVTIGGGTSGNLTALGNTTAQYATGMYGTITVNAGSTGGNLNGMVGSINNSGTSNTIVGVAAQIQGAGTFSGNVFAFFNPSATNNTGLTNSNPARAASNYYFLWNDDAVAQNRLGSLRAYHTYQYSTATTGTVNIDKNNGQTQFINPTGNVTIGDFQNFVTTAFDSVNNDNQSDIVTLIIEQGATPYAITMPTGNASIRYANGNSTVPATANSTVTISIQGYRSAANAAAYITTISPGYN